MQHLQPDLGGAVRARARIRGDAIEEVTVSMDGESAAPMQAMGDSTWSAIWNAHSIANGSHSLSVAAMAADGQTTRDTIMVLVNQQSNYEVPVRHDVDYEKVLATWIGKDIVGTQLGPNKSGLSWPPAGNGRACMRRA